MGAARVASRWLAFGLIAAALVSCSSDDPVEGPSLPGGVTPGAWGDTVQMGESLPMVLADAAGGTTGALVHLTAEDPAPIPAEALRLFAGVPEAATVFQVAVSMANRGPDVVDMTQELGWFLRVDDVLVPPTLVTGPLDGCEAVSVPEELATGADYTTCLVFIVADGQYAESVDYLRHDRVQTVSWAMPDLADAS